MSMNTETSDASRTRPTTLADMEPLAKEAHMNDAHIMAHITFVRGDMGKLSRDMEAFNRHPEIMKASQNAEKYGMPQAAALHQALDQNPKLKEMFSGKCRAYRARHHGLRYSHGESSRRQRCSQAADNGKPGETRRTRRRPAHHSP